MKIIFAIITVVILAIIVLTYINKKYKENDYEDEHKHIKSSNVRIMMSPKNDNQMMCCKSMG